MKKIKTEHVAQIMGLDVQTVRILAQQGRLDFAEAIKRNKKYFYLYHPVKLAEWRGITVNELLELLEEL